MNYRDAFSLQDSRNSHEDDSVGSPSAAAAARVAATGPYYAHPISPVNRTESDEIDSLLWGDKWKDGSGKAASLTYSFGHSGSVYDPDYSEVVGSGWQFYTEPLTNDQKAAATKALGLWANVANITFGQVTDSSSVAGDIRFSRIDFAGLGDPGIAGRAIPPGAGIKYVDSTSTGPHPADGDVWLTDTRDLENVSDHSFGFLTIIHEIGHALGLAHPHDTGGQSEIADPSIDWIGDTVMSYRSYVEAPDYDTTDRFPSTPMLNDIKTIQYIYGANIKFNDDDTTYDWQPGEKIFETIWDGGGIDTIDWSNQGSDARIDLNEGKWSELGPAYDPDILSSTNELEKRTLTIADDADIENANGGSGNDKIYGNSLNNNLRGFGGNDNIYLYGGGGSDRVDAGAGNDFVYIDSVNFRRIDGSVGHDRFHLDMSNKELNLTKIPDARTAGFEEIDLNRQGNSLVMSPSDVVNLSKTSNTVTVFGNSTNSVRLTDTWVQEDAETVSSTTFSVFVKDQAVVRVQQGVQVFVEIQEDEDDTPPAFYDLSEMATDASTLNGFAANGKSGDAVSAAGDVNSDGYDDVIVGAAASNEAYVVFGGVAGIPSDIDLNKLDGGNGFRIEGESDSDRFGRSVRAAGDVNNDGIDDLIVGAPEADPAGRKDAGVSYVLFGSDDGFDAVVDAANLDGSNGFALNGAKRYDKAGYRVDGAGDVNGDGIADLMVGAFGLDGNGDRSGGTYIVYGNADGDHPTIDLKKIDGGFDGFRLDGVSKLDLSGVALRQAGDVNGDGYADIIIGASSASRDGKNHVGESYVVFGSEAPADVRINLADLDGNNGFRMTGLDAEDWFGRSVGGGGDINSDGFDDVIIGAPGGDPTGKKNGGEAYVIFGQTDGFEPSFDLTELDGNNGFRIDAAAAGDEAGFRVDFAGDVNGDGFSDLMIGAPKANKPGVKDAGAAMVVFGKADGFDATMTLQGPDGVNVIRINGESGSDQAGSSVSAAGDVDGDGYDDFIIGAPKANVDGQANAGKSYVVYGRDYTGKVTHEGNAASNKILGTTGADVMVAGAGNDLLRGYGGADVMRGGAGNDVLAIADNDFLQLIGGNGIDTVRLDGDGVVFDLQAIPDNQVTGIERISLNGDGNELVLNPVELADLSDETNTLTVTGNTTNSVSADLPGFSFQENSAEGFTEYTNGVLTLRVRDGIDQSNILADDFSADTSTTGTISVGGSATGEIAPGNTDKDWFRVALVGGQTYQIDLEGAATNAGTLSDPFLRGIYDSDGSPTGLSDDDGGTGSNSKLEFTASSTGDYYLEAGSHGAADTGTYKLSVSLIGTADDFSADTSTTGTVAVGGSATGEIAPGNTDKDWFKVSLIAGQTYQIDLEGSATGAGTLNNPYLRGVYDAAGSPTGFRDDNSGVGSNSQLMFTATSTGNYYLEAGSFGATDVGTYRLSVSLIPSDPQQQIDLSGLNGSNGFVVEGALAGNLTGISVAAPGDTDGDGFDDVLIGAPGLIFAPGFFRGEAYLVHGAASFGASMSRSDIVGGAGVVFENAYISGGIGATVSGGDIDGDGLSDITLTARNGFADLPPYGVYSYIVLSSSITGTTYDVRGLDGTNGVVIFNIPDTTLFAGDINGDGFGDVATAHHNPDGNPVENETAKVSISLGGEIPYPVSLFDESDDGNPPHLLGQTPQTTIIDGIEKHSQIPLNVSNLGDFNGDGFTDLGIGAAFGDLNIGINLVANAYIVFGGEKFFVDVRDEDPAAGFKIEGLPDPLSRSGPEVKGLGDINGDGFSDASISADNQNYVLFGAANGLLSEFNVNDIDGTNGFRLLADGVVQGVGDVNADGLDDFVAGSRLVFGRATGFGQTFDVSTDNSTIDIVRNGEAWTRGLTMAGDVNGDGFGDMIASDELADPNNRKDAGETYVVFGADFTDSVTHQGTAGNNKLIGGASADIMVGGRGNDTLIGNGGDDALIGGAGNDELVIDDFSFQRVSGGNGIDRLRLDTSGKRLDLTKTLDAEIVGLEEVNLHGNSNKLTLSPQDLLNLSNTSNMLVVFGNGSNSVQLSGAWGQDGSGSTGGFAYTDYVSGEAVLRVDRDVAVTGAVPKVVELSALNGSNGLTLTGIDAKDFAGAAVAIAGDLNNDGFDDAFVGAFAADPGGVSRAGETYVMFGGPGGFSATFPLGSLNGSNGFRLDGVVRDDFSGGPVAPAGDINGDGIDDLIIGAAGVSVGGAEDTGAAYLVFGRSGGFSAALDLDALNGSNGFRLHGVDGGDNAGFWVDTAGDVNADGLADLIIGAPGAANGAGEAYVVFGQAGGFAADIDLGALNGSTGFRINGASAGDGLGQSVQGVGDINGDRINDVFVGAPSANGGTGASYVIFGSESGFPAGLDVGDLNGGNGFRLTGVGPNDNTGIAVGDAGDFNGDGIGDLVIGASRADPNSPNDAGVAYVVFGNRGGFTADLDLDDLDGGNGFRLDGIDLTDFAGRAVSGVGDFNADGFDDILVGAFLGDPDGVTDAGESYLIFGTDQPQPPVLNLEEINGLNGLRIDGASQADASGRAVHGGGDFNGDGFDDLIIGAAEADPSGRDRAGEAHILFGNDATLTATEIGTAGADTLEGNVYGNVLIGGRGDDTLNGKGGRDVLVGGAGDDVLNIADNEFQRLSGGSGTDRVGLVGEQIWLSLDNSALAKLIDIEEFDLLGTGNRIILDRVALANLSSDSNTVTIHGQSGNGAAVRADFSGQGFSAVDSGGFTVFSDGILTLRVDDDIDQSHILIG